MALSAENILQTFFQAPQAGISTQQLAQLAADEPYYGVVHFLLAKELYDAKQEDYEQALQKAALHFSNELFLHYNLNVAEEDLITVEPAAETNIQPPFTADELSPDEDEDFPAEEMPVSDIAEYAILNNKLASILQQQAAAFEKPVEPAAEVIVETTPFHRIDYL